MPVFDCYATTAPADDGTPPGVDVVDEHGLLVRRTERPPGWAGPDGKYDTAVLDTELAALGMRRLNEWEFGAAYAHAIAEPAT